MKVLNTYCGIGGNRKLWTDCDVTAIEINKDIAAIYKEFYPDDIVIVADAHEYLLNNLKILILFGQALHVRRIQILGGVVCKQDNINRYIQTCRYIKK